MSDKAPWITYRPELKVLDCTIRDGGLINDSRFTDDQVKAVYETCIEAGIDYMEIGYKNSIEAFPARQVRPVAALQGGGSAPGGGRTTSSAATGPEAGGDDGRRRQVRLAEGPAAQEGERH
jgi:hypothetical protein